VALESTEKSMELVLDHDGITASASVKYGINVGKDKTSSDDDISNEESSNSQTNAEGKKT
jgi:hypothetical protein